MIFSTAFLGLSLHCAIGAAPAEGTPILSLNEAVQTALSQQPQLRQSHAFVDVASARADEARASLLPQLTAQARTDEANARVQLINAENNYQTAKAQLNQAIGIERSTSYEIGNDTVPPFAEEDATVEPLLAK